MHNTNTPKAEAKVIVRRLLEDNTWSAWEDAVGFDPIMLPVESEGYTDVFDDSLAAVIDAMEELTGLDYFLVWSDTGNAVKGTCPVCDDSFSVWEGYVGDTLNEGYDAVCCGCDPNDE